jgi:hypothetical protein
MAVLHKCHTCALRMAALRLHKCHTQGQSGCGIVTQECHLCLAHGLEDGEGGGHVDTWQYYIYTSVTQVWKCDTSFTRA